MTILLRRAPAGCRPSGGCGTTAGAGSPGKRRVPARSAGFGHGAGVGRRLPARESCATGGAARSRRLREACAAPSSPRPPEPRAVPLAPFNTLETRVSWRDATAPEITEDSGAAVLNRSSVRCLCPRLLCPDLHALSGTSLELNRGKRRKGDEERRGKRREAERRPCRFSARLARLVRSAPQPRADLSTRCPVTPLSSHGVNKHVEQRHF